MPCLIENKTDTTVLLRLRSGMTLHLGARQTSPQLEDADIRGNPRIDSLVERGSIAVVEAERAPARGTPKGPQRSARTTTAAKRRTPRTAAAKKEDEREQ
jgi:hypothetical protein